MDRLPLSLASSLALLASGTAAAQSTVVGVDVRQARFFTSTADSSFVTNFVNNGATGGLPLFAIDYDAAAMTLWGVNNTTLQYGTIDLGTATFSPVGTVTGTTPTGATGLTASPNGSDWYLSTFTGVDTDLYVGDVTTGAFTLVGTMTGAGLMIDISMSSTGRLIGHSISTDSFYDIDPATGVATLIGPHGLLANFAQGMDFDWSTDTLFATIYTGGGTGGFFTVDLTTGAVTLLANTQPLNAEMEIAIQRGAGGPTAIAPGSDFWITPGLGDTHQDFSTLPIPPSFFGPGSLPFTGDVVFRGLPLMGTNLGGGVDTIVQRLGPLDLPACGSSAQVPIEIVALSLRSVQPIAVQFGTQTSFYDVTATLSSQFPQQPGMMQVQRTHASGGTFSSLLPVVPRLLFNKVAGTAGNNNAVLELPQPILFQSPTPGGPPPCWSFDNGGFDIVASPGGFVDHDRNPGTPDRPYDPTSPNFFVGICRANATCFLPGCPPQPMLTQEDAMLAAHGVLPVRIPMLVGRNYCNPAVPNSTGCPAFILGIGSDVVAMNNFSLEARSMPVGAFGYFLASLGQIAIMPVGSQGILCVGPTIGRGVGGVIFISDPMGEATVMANLNLMPQPTGPVIVMPGDTWNFQGWFRDANPTPTSNLTDGLEVLFR